MNDDHCAICDESFELGELAKLVSIENEYEPGLWEHFWIHPEHVNDDASYIKLTG